MHPIILDMAPAGGLLTWQPAWTVPCAAILGEAPAGCQLPWLPAWKDPCAAVMEPFPKHGAGHLRVVMLGPRALASQACGAIWKRHGCWTAGGLRGPAMSQGLRPPGTPWSRQNSAFVSDTYPFRIHGPQDLMISESEALRASRPQGPPKMKT